MRFVDERQRESDVDQHPVARAGALALGVKQPDVDLALHTGDVDEREAIGLVDDLDDPAWNRQAHGAFLLRVGRRPVGLIGGLSLSDTGLQGT